MIQYLKLLNDEKMNYLKRVVRGVYYFPNTILQFYQLLKLKSLGVKFGRHISFNGLTRWYISNPKGVVIGDNFTMNSNQKCSIDMLVCSKVAVGNDAQLKIGNNCGMTNTSIQCYNSISIGNHTIIGAGCLIMDSDFHDLSWEARRRLDVGCSTSKTAPIKIGDDCFIGARTIICKGVSIGNRCVIAAGSVVIKDIPDDEVWGGNPARFIKK